MKIIYPKDDSGIAVIIPTIECGLTLEEIARKETPSGVPYRIVHDEDIPSDRTFRAAWEADFSNPDGYGIGHKAWFAEQEFKGPNNVNSTILSTETSSTSLTDGVGA